MISSMPSSGGEAVVGMGPVPPDMAAGGMPPMWNSYVTVDNVDATLAKVEGAGGSVFMPAMDVTDVGRMAGIMDPTGAGIMIWQANEHFGAEVRDEHGALAWFELITPDVGAAAAFYAEVFGWGTETTPMPEMTYTVFTLGDEQVGGAMAPPADGIPPNWGIYFNVDDADDVATRAEAGGATVLAEPFDSPPGRLATFADPVGAIFSIIQPVEQD